MIDSGLEALWIYATMHSKRKAWTMMTTTTNVMKTTMTTSTINFRGWERWENMIND